MSVGRWLAMTVVLLGGGVFLATAVSRAQDAAPPDGGGATAPAAVGTGAAAAAAEDVAPAAVSEPAGAAPAGEEPAPAPAPRAVIRTAVVALRSFTPAETMDQAVRALEEMGGWILESETGRAEFRIPAAQLDDALRVLRRTGEVVQEDVKSEDVSMEIATLQGRIDELDRARRRVQELLAVATTTKEALDVEQRLAEITEDLEAQQGRVRFLEQRVAESPLTLGVSMRGRPAPQGVRRRPPFPWVEDYGLDALLRAQ